MLIEHHASVNDKTQSDYTLLMDAVTYASEEMVRLLLEYGANIHARDDIGWTALHYAARKHSRRKLNALTMQIKQLLISEQTLSCMITWFT